MTRLDSNQLTDHSVSLNQGAEHDQVDDASVNRSRRDGVNEGAQGVVEQEQSRYWERSTNLELLGGLISLRMESKKV